MDHSQGNHRHDMILERGIFSKLEIYLCFSDNKIRVNGGSYKVRTAPIKDFSNINFNASYDSLKGKICFGTNNYGKSNMYRTKRDSRIVS